MALSQSLCSYSAVVPTAGEHKNDMAAQGADYSWALSLHPKPHGNVEFDSRFLRRPLAKLVSCSDLCMDRRSALELPGSTLGRGRFGVSVRGTVSGLPPSRAMLVAAAPAICTLSGGLFAGKSGALCLLISL